MNTYPCQTVEYWFFPTVAEDGVATTSFKYAVTLDGVRSPATTDTDDWAIPATVADKRAFLLDGLRPPGRYQVWVLVDDQDEHVVMSAGLFQLV